MDLGKSIFHGLSNRSCPKYNRPLAIKETHQRLTQNIHHQHTFSDVANMNSAIHIGRFLRPGLTFLKVWHGLKAYWKTGFRVSHRAIAK